MSNQKTSTPKTSTPNRLVMSIRIETSAGPGMDSSVTTFEVDTYNGSAFKFTSEPSTLYPADLKFLADLAFLIRDNKDRYAPLYKKEDGK